MEIGGAVKVEYWAVQDGKYGLIDVEGIDEFKAALAENYVAQVHGRPGPLGGLYGFTFDFSTTLTLHHFVQLLQDGMAWDLLKSAAGALVLRPFISAFRALKAKSKERPNSSIHLETIRLIFQDSVVRIREEGVGAPVLDNLESIVRTLAENFQHMTLQTGETPYLIDIPIFEDTTPEAASRFRQVGDIDETLVVPEKDAYVTYWGAQYDYARTTRVFDVKRQLLLDESYLELNQYWDILTERYRKEREQAASGGEGKTPTKL
jgi:hypothetical protein